jgi:hypothetical protein
LRRSIALAEHPGEQTQVLYVWTAGPHILPSAGLSYDELSDTWSGTMTMSGQAGEHMLGARKLAFEDYMMDVNADGRFNVLDVAALDWVANNDPTNPDYVNRWDFNGTGKIDADDVAILQIPVDLGLDSGVFADLDADGIADCDNWQTIDSMFGYHLGEAGYYVQLDYNLDGVTDEQDRLVFRTQVCGTHVYSPADMDCDGFVDAMDIDPFVLALSNPSGYATAYPNCNWMNADCNADQAVNAFDIDPFVTCVINGGCP